MAKKKTIGRQVGNMIDNSLDGAVGALIKVISTPGNILKTIHEENEQIGLDGRVYRATKGSLTNIKRDNSAGLNRELLPPEVVQRARRRHEG